jgi:hypothetical protein
MFKFNELLVLFGVLVLMLFINPNYFYNIYNTTLGKLILLVIVAFFTMNNLTLGLLFALVLIIFSKKYEVLTEGIDNIKTPDTVGSIQKKDDKIDTITPTGINISELEESIRSKQSHSIPVDKIVSMSNENISPFTSGMLTNTSNLTEGFCPCASSL